VSFTRDGKFAVVCTRLDYKDYVNLLSCHSWEVMGTFTVDTLDLSGVEWAPDDSSVVVCDSLLEYKVLLICLFISLGTVILRAKLNFVFLSLFY
jgi:hypothetical protein